MATQILSDQELFFDGLKLTGITNAMDLLHGVETQNDTTFGDTTSSEKGGLKIIEFGASGFFDATPFDQVLFADVGLDSKPVSAAMGSAEGSRAFFFNSTLGKYTPIKGSVGDLIGYDISAAAQDNLVRGQLLCNQSALTASGQRTGYQVGAIGAGQVGHAALHVFNISGTSPTIDMVIESDDNAGFTSPITRFTFSQVTARGSQYLKLSSAITDTYWRAKYTIGGSGVSIGVAVVFGIV